MSSQARRNPPFRAEHIGSLLRPGELIQGHRDFAAQKISAEAFRRIQDKCIEEVVRLQEDVGLQSITDGEFRRGSYFGHFIDALTGMTDKEAVFAFRDASGEEFKFRAPHVAGKLKRERGISTGEFQFLKAVTKRTPKLTMPAPSTMHFYRGHQGVDDAAYPDKEVFFADLIRIYREELADLFKLGATYIQMDEVSLAMLCDPTVRDAVKSRGEDPEWLTAKYIALINAVLQDRPEQVTVGVHLCRGNYKARWLSEGGYNAVADRLFNDVNVNVFFLEYDTSRAGGFEPLKLLPSNKTVVLGLVSSKTPQMESSDVLKKRVEEASRFVPLERLAISPQCGFATTVGSVPMTLANQIEKLRLVVNTAREIWG